MGKEVGGSSPSERVREEKLYVLARADLDVGIRTAQVGHALIAWVLEHGKPPENLVVLQVPNEDILLDYADLCCGYTGRGQETVSRYALFSEPDLGDQHTALAIGPEGWKFLSNLPLLR